MSVKNKGVSEVSEMSMKKFQNPKMSVKNKISKQKQRLKFSEIKKNVLNMRKSIFSKGKGSFF